MGEIGPIPVLERTFDGPALNKEYNASTLPPLLDTLIETRICKSTLAADKVYGILGFVSEEDRARIKVDYAFDGADVFKQIALAELERNGLSMLGLCTKSAKCSTLDCPSWVPDWTQPCHHTPLSRLGYKSSAAGITHPNYRIEKNVLIIRGRIIDVIEAVELARSIPASKSIAVPHPGILSGPNWQGLFGKYIQKSKESSKEWVSCAMEMAMAIAYDEDQDFKHNVYEALWRSFCCNQTPNGKIPGEEYRSYFGEFVAVNVADVDTANSLKGIDTEHLKARMQKFVACFGRWCANRRFFRSKEGRFGWGPDQTRPGDVVCILNGSPIPFILRPATTGGFEWGPGQPTPGDLLVVDDGGPVRMVLRPEKNGCYEIVGDAYVHGIMDGEGMELGFEELDIRLA